MLGCEQGRTDDDRIDWKLPRTPTRHPQGGPAPTRAHNPVVGDDVPVPHFGLTRTVARFRGLADRLKTAQQHFVIEPYVRFKGQAGEQWTMLL